MHRTFWRKCILYSPNRGARSRLAAGGAETSLTCLTRSRDHERVAWANRLLVYASHDDPDTHTARPAPAHRFTLRSGATDDHAGPDDGGRQRHVCGGRGDACGASRIWRGAGRCLAALHPHDDRLWHWRHPDGAAGRPFWRDGATADWRHEPGPGLRRGGHGGQHLDVHTGAWFPDRPFWQLGHLCAAAG